MKLSQFVSGVFFSLFLILPGSAMADAFSEKLQEATKIAVVNAEFFRSNSEKLESDIQSCSLFDDSLRIKITESNFGLTSSFFWKEVAYFLKQLRKGYEDLQKPNYKDPEIQRLIVEVMNQINRNAAQAFVDLSNNIREGIKGWDIIGERLTSTRSHLESPDEKKDYRGQRKHWEIVKMAGFLNGIQIAANHVETYTIDDFFFDFKESIRILRILDDFLVNKDGIKLQKNKGKYWIDQIVDWQDVLALGGKSDNTPEVRKLFVDLSQSSELKRLSAADYLSKILEIREKTNNLLAPFKAVVEKNSIKTDREIKSKTAHVQDEKEPESQLVSLAKEKLSLDASNLIEASNLRSYTVSASDDFEEAASIAAFSSQGIDQEVGASSASSISKGLDRAKLENDLIEEEEDTFEDEGVDPKAIHLRFQETKRLTRTMSFNSVLSTPPSDVSEEEIEAKIWELKQKLSPKSMEVLGTAMSVGEAISTITNRELKDFLREFSLGTNDGNQLIFPRLGTKGFFEFKMHLRHGGKETFPFGTLRAFLGRALKRAGWTQEIVKRILSED